MLRQVQGETVEVIDHGRPISSRRECRDRRRCAPRRHPHRSGDVVGPDVGVVKAPTTNRWLPWQASLVCLTLVHHEYDRSTSTGRYRTPSHICSRADRAALEWLQASRSAGAYVALAAWTRTYISSWMGDRLGPVGQAIPPSRLQSPFSGSPVEVGVEIDAVAVWVSELRIALTPERVPRLFVALPAHLESP